MTCFQAEFENASSLNSLCYSNPQQDRRPGLQLPTEGTLISSASAATVEEIVFTNYVRKLPPLLPHAHLPAEKSHDPAAPTSQLNL